MDRSPVQFCLLVLAANLLALWVNPNVHYLPLSAAMPESTMPKSGILFHLALPCPRWWWPHCSSSSDCDLPSCFLPSSPVFTLESFINSWWFIGVTSLQLFTLASLVPPPFDTSQPFHVANQFLISPHCHTTNPYEGNWHSSYPMTVSVPEHTLDRVVKTKHWVRCFKNLIAACSWIIVYFSDA